jgi:pyruvate, water dikinase
VVQHGNRRRPLHYYGSWFDDPSIPYASLIGHVAALKAGDDIERPTEQLARERDRLAEEYGSLLDEETRKGFEELLGLSRTVFPYVEEHKFFCDYWFLTRWWNKIREFGALLAEHGFVEDSEDVFQLSRTEVGQALDELVLTWSTGGAPIGPKHWPPIVARRKEMLERLADWTPPPALGAVPEAVTDPALVMLWGVTTERVREWARSQDGGLELTGAAASPGVAEGVARVVKTVREISDVRDGEVLVCTITSPAWAPIFSKITAAVTDIGGVMSHAAIVCREYGLPAVVGTGRATSTIRTGQRVRVDGTAGTVSILEDAR